MLTPDFAQGAIKILVGALPLMVLMLTGKPAPAGDIAWVSGLAGFAIAFVAATPQIAGWF